uniref:Heme oxygenase 1 n=1 Tax=Ornithorhynchus anatinus TaxID=9258 RepID=F7AF62_ORNAN
GDRPRERTLRKADLSEALKEATKEVHTQAENVEFLKNFQKGQVSRNGFKLVMSSLYHIYRALEEEIERHKAHPAYAPIYFPEELHRLSALQEDMEYWYGPRWREEIPFPEATRRYVARLHHLGREEPELLMAHAYTRYLGDLSGGQILKKIAQKALRLPDGGEGLAFFSFPSVANATKFKQLYRARMNSIEMSPETKRRVLAEARASFLFNIQVFEELQELESQNAENDTLKQQKTELRARSNDKVQENEESRRQAHVLSPVPFLRWILTFSFLVATVAVGFYAM